MRCVDDIMRCVEIGTLEVAVRQSYVRLFIGAHDNVKIYDAMFHIL